MRKNQPFYTYHQSNLKFISCAISRQVSAFSLSLSNSRDKTSCPNTKRILRQEISETKSPANPTKQKGEIKGKENQKKKAEHEFPFKAMELGAESNTYYSADSSPRPAYHPATRHGRRSHTRLLRSHSRRPARPSHPPAPSACTNAPTQDATPPAAQLPSTQSPSPSSTGSPHSPATTDGPRTRSGARPSLYQSGSPGSPAAASAAPAPPRGRSPGSPSTRPASDLLRRASVGGGGEISAGGRLGRGRGGREWGRWMLRRRYRWRPRGGGRRSTSASRARCWEMQCRRTTCLGEIEVERGKRLNL